MNIKNIEEPTDVQLRVAEVYVDKYLNVKQWNVCKCRYCQRFFNLLKVRFRNDNPVCSHCGMEN